MARIEKRGKSWRITVSLGYDSNNKQIRATKTINDIGYTKTEVKKMASEFELEVSRKKFTNDKNLTLSDFIGYWEKEYALQDGVYSPTTIARNKNLLARIIPALGHIRLSKLKPTHLISFYNYLREEDVRADGKIGFLSSRTIQMHHKLLSSILENELTDSNNFFFLSNLPDWKKTVSLSKNPKALRFCDLIESYSSSEKTVPPNGKCSNSLSFNL